MYDPRDRVFSSSNSQPVSEPAVCVEDRCASSAPTVRSCAGARSTVFLIGNQCAQRFQPTRGDSITPQIARRGSLPAMQDRAGHSRSQAARG
jgi:hypothetical protein